MLSQAMTDDRELITKGLMTQEEFDQEWLLSTDAAIKGSYYTAQLAAAREDGRVTRVPYDPALPVDTDWDLGVGDSTVIWFTQSLRSGEVHVIDYYENSGEGIPHYASVLQAKRYVYGQHWAPHDIRVRELGTGKSRLETAQSHGIKFQVTPNIGVDDGIAAGSGRPGSLPTASGGPLYRRSLDQLDAVPIAGTANVFEPFFSRDGEWVGYIDRADNTLKKVRLDGGQPIPLCRLGSVLRSASWGSDDTIVFSYLGTSGLWRVSADGGEPEPTHPGVTADDSSGESTLRWVDLLPDGRAALASTGGLETESQVVVVSVDTGERQALFEGSTPRYAATGHIVYWRQGALWAVPFDDIRRAVTGSPTPVLEGVAFQALTGKALFAIGGSTLLYAREGQFGTSALVWVNRDGTEEVVDAEPREYFSVQLSPDGLRAAATMTVDSDNQDVFIVDLARTLFTPLTLAPGADIWPTFSHDGVNIAYSRAQGGALWKRADGTGEATRLTEPGVLTFITSFSPEGRLAVVGRTDPETGLDIGLLSMDGGDIDWVLTEPYNETHAMVSPDGRWMAYVSEESGSAEVYVRPFPNVTDRRWPISRDGGLSPVWAPDSRELFFLATTDTETRVMAVDLETDQAFAAGNPRRLFSGPYRAPVPTTAPTWDIDGERFLMLKSAVPASTSTSTAAVLNWTEELKRLVPAN